MLSDSLGVDTGVGWLRIRERFGPSSRCPIIRWVHRAKGFTLIEVLVVVAIVALLLAIALPTLGHARATGKMAAELATGQQLLLAVTMYANDNRDAVPVGYPPASWVNPPGGPMVVLDDAGNRLAGGEAQRYPWRIGPYLDNNLQALYLDRAFLGRLKERADYYAGLGITHAYVISLFPALGMNVAFVGGSDRHAQFGAAFQRLYGRVHVSRLDEVRRPSGLMMFASARSAELTQLPGETRLEGFYRVEPPYFAPHEGRRWSAAYEPRTPDPGVNSGFVSLRHCGRAVTAFVDGHAGTASWERVQDMRLWANSADRADWTLPPR